MARPEIFQYLNHIEKVRRYSKHTIIAYKTDLTQFSVFIQKDLLTANRKDVRGFLIDLKHNGYSLRTINRKLEVLRSFYRHYRRHTEFANFPCSYIYAFRYVKLRSSYLPVDSMRKVLDGIQPTYDRNEIRDKLILELLYHTGCRANEIMALRVKNIDFDRLQAKVFGKGKVERIVPLNRKICKLIRKHLRLWAGKNLGPFLFTTNKGEPLYPMFLWRLVKRYFKIDELGVNVTTHTLRHSFATHLYHKRAPVNAIRDLMGHRALKITVPYLHLDVNILIAIHESCHPKAGTVRKKRAGHLSGHASRQGERKVMK